VSGYQSAQKLSEVPSVSLILMLITITDLTGSKVGITEHFQKSLLQGLKW